MKYKITKFADIPKREKFGINLNIYPDISDSGIVLVNTEIGHNQEFYDRQSVFTYIILEGSGEFCVDDEAVKVATGDIIAIQPNTRIYYKGKLKMLLLTTPPWKQKNEVETKSSIW